jgi:predicted AlkP superfamily phosphohydrolase/phosphomutase
MEGWTPLNPFGFLVFGYIGPGAGFAFAGYVMIVLTALLVLLGALLLWPFRILLSPILHRNRPKAATRRRVIILGLDGLDPGIADTLFARGELPNLNALAEAGGFHRLQSTIPPISPVAWSTFMTGANPGKHNIFDFVNRDPGTYQLRLSTADIRPRAKGKGDQVRGLRKSKPFWHVLSEAGVVSTILRVPVTFPAEKMRGRLLAGMSVPDLRGSQGTGFAWAPEGYPLPDADALAVGTLAKTKKGYAGTLPGGPPLPGKEEESFATLAFHLDAPASNNPNLRYRLRIQGRRVPLTPGAYSPWIRVAFSIGRGKRAHGITRFLLLEEDDNHTVRLYATPVHIDPERPAMPISWPNYYAMALAKRQGSFATAGIAEDTAAYNEDVIDAQGFLDQVYAIHEEREAMFLHDLARTRSGVSCCVFDTPDRIQHMFYREYAEAGDDPRDTVLAHMYRRMDDLVGKTRKRMRKRDILFVLSDHGFTAFRRGVNLNTWLREQGYLVLKKDAGLPDGLQQADWAHTRAYALGLSGIFLNRAGREREGVVPEEAADSLLEELVDKLAGLTDPDTGETAIHRAHRADRVYDGPYRDQAPDLIMGYAAGYRVSWSGALGRLEESVFSDNDRRWSGDHCVDPDVVPGVLFSSVPLGEEASPRLMDIAPTVLSLFDVPIPQYMDGRPLELKFSASE